MYYILRLTSVFLLALTLFVPITHVHAYDNNALNLQEPQTLQWTDSVLPSEENALSNENLAFGAEYNFATLPLNGDCYRLYSSSTAFLELCGTSNASTPSLRAWTSSQGPTTGDVSTTYTFKLNKWYKIAVLRSSRTPSFGSGFLHIYIDGANIATLDLLSPANDTAYSTHIWKVTNGYIRNAWINTWFTNPLNMSYTTCPTDGAIVCFPLATNLTNTAHPSWHAPTTSGNFAYVPPEYLSDYSSVALIANNTIGEFKASGLEWMLYVMGWSLPIMITLAVGKFAITKFWKIADGGDPSGHSLQEHQYTGDYVTIGNDKYEKYDHDGSLSYIGWQVETGRWGKYDKYSNRNAYEKYYQKYKSFVNNKNLYTPYGGK